LSPADEPGRLELGDIVSIHSTESLAYLDTGRYYSNEPLSNPRIGIIHCTAVPDNVAAKIQVLSMGDDVSGNSRMYYFHFPSLPPLDISYLQNESETTLSWGDAVTFIRDRVGDLGITDQDIVDFE
jgi:hypothetical protein